MIIIGVILAMVLGAIMYWVSDFLAGNRKKFWSFD